MRQRRPKWLLERLIEPEEIRQDGDLPELTAGVRDDRGAKLHRSRLCQTPWMRNHAVSRVNAIALLNACTAIGGQIEPVRS